MGFTFAVPARSDDGVRVVASIRPVHSLVSAVMAGAGEPHLLMRGAGNHHTFSLRPSDAAKLSEADIVFIIDERMEASLVAPIQTLTSGALIVELSHAKGLVRQPLREGGAFEVDSDHHHGDSGHGHDHDDDGRGHGHNMHEMGTYDLHLWSDPVNAWAMTRMIADILSEVDPANADLYANNVQQVTHRLDGLTEEVAALVEPARGKPFIIFHDNYRYFEDRFGLTAVGSAVVSDERSPGVKRIRELRRKIRELGVVCIFTEPQFDTRLAATLIERTQARAGILDTLGAGIKDGPELYFDYLRNLATSFRDCLAPEDTG